VIQHQWVDTPSSLESLADALQAGALVGIDTEADSMHHYRESVCLVQITQNGQNWLLDSLSPLNLQPLWEKLKMCPWILHGADFDLRLLRRIGAPEPLGVFDTMIAAQLLGYPAIGYAAQVERFCGVVLHKGPQTQDWSLRPLPPKMIHYAVQDSFHLEPVASAMATELEALGRREWHRQSSDRVRRTSQVLREGDPEEDWRISGANKLSPSALAILRELWLWREGEGEHRDVPVFKVLMNEKMLALAVWADEHRESAGPAAETLPRNCHGSRYTRLVEALDRGRKAAPLERIKSGPRPPRNPEAEKRFASLKAARDRIASDLKIDPTVLASKSILTALSYGASPDLPDKLIAEDRWCPWQRDLLKDAL
jgi:ribonuclease D